MKLPGFTAEQALCGAESDVSGSGSAPICARKPPAAWRMRSAISDRVEAPVAQPGGDRRSRGAK